MLGGGGGGHGKRREGWGWEDKLEEIAGEERVEMPGVQKPLSGWGVVAEEKDAPIGASTPRTARQETESLGGEEGEQEITGWQRHLKEKTRSNGLKEEPEDQKREDIWAKLRARG